MEENYTLRTGLCLWKNDKQAKNNHDYPQFDLEGTEEEIFYKLNLQLCAVFAHMYSELDKVDLTEKLKELKSKYINNKCECK